MEHIVVVAFLVSCSTNLLECRQLGTDEYFWRETRQCEAALPGLKRRFRGLGYKNILGRCEYLLDEEHRYAPVG